MIDLSIYYYFLTLNMPVFKLPCSLINNTFKLMLFNYLKLEIFLFFNSTVCSYVASIAKMSFEG